jgi:hypothetical protein
VVIEYCRIGTGYNATSGMKQYRMDQPISYRKKHSMRSRIPVILLITIVVPLGFTVKYYSGPGREWFNLYGAAVLYELFWCLAIFLIIPSRKAIPFIAASVLFITCVLELLQLFHHSLLAAVRSSLVGVWLIGNSFDWYDFPHYVAGCAIGWLVLRQLGTPVKAGR